MSHGRLGRGNGQVLPSGLRLKTCRMKRPECSRDFAATLPHSAGTSERYTQDRRRKNLETDEEEQVSTGEVMHCR